MNSLKDRLEAYKFMKNLILDGKTDNGYDVSFKRCRVSFSYRELDGKLVVDRNVSFGLSSRTKTVKILDSLDKEKGRKICYDKTLSYLRNNSRFLYGELWDSGIIPYKTGDGEIATIATFPIFSGKPTKFGKLEDKMQKRINRKRAEKGLEPAAAYV